MRLPLRLIAPCLITLAWLAQSPASAVAAVDDPVAEQAWVDAQISIANGHYRKALQSLRALQREHADFSHMPAVQARVAVLHEAAPGDAVAAQIFMALEAREAGRIEQAMAALGALADEDPTHPLGDDALYLQAYVQLMDRYDFAMALETLARLRARYPESAYTDTADYLTAIALEQLGRHRMAVTELQKLRDRHTGLALPFGVRWPAEGFLSRFWFDRANRRLTLLGLQQKSGAQLISRQVTGEQFVARIEAAGETFELVLTPAELSRYLASGGPQLYTGHVSGEPDSWARVLIDGTRVQGALGLGRLTHVLRPATLTGTLDYYHPKLGPPRDMGNEPALRVRMARGSMPVARTTSPAALADVRVVPVSLVVDSQFDRYHNGEGVTRALGQLHVADGLYRRFGLSFTADQVVRVDSDETHPSAAGPQTLEAMLRHFRLYRLHERNRFSHSALTFLFTGNEKTDVTLGLAWIDTLCRTDGYDVGVTTPSSVGDLLLAHELGHSLGARHDSDTQCAQPTHQLMWPHLSERTAPEFTECAAGSIRPARQHQCLLDAVDLQLDARTSTQGVTLDMVNLDSQLSVAARLLIDVSEPVDWALPIGCHWADPGSMRCELASIAAGETVALRLDRLQRLDRRPAPIQVQLEPVAMRDPEPGNNQLSLTFTDLPDAPLMLATPAPSSSPAAQPVAPARPSVAAASGGGGFDVRWLLGMLVIRLGIGAHRSARLQPRRSPRVTGNGKG